MAQKFNYRYAQPLGVDTILSRTLKRYRLDKGIERYQFVLHWPKIVGDEIAKRTAPECLRNGALVVRVPSSAYAQDLSFQKEEILHRLRKYLGKDEVVDDIRFVTSYSPNT